MVLLKDMNCQLCPEGNKKGTVTNIKNNGMKLKDEVGMAGPKSTQIRFVGIIISTIYPYACFLSGAQESMLTDFPPSLVIIRISPTMSCRESRRLKG
jgi:hypothetical protein